MSNSERVAAHLGRCTWRAGAADVSTCLLNRTSLCMAHKWKLTSVQGLAGRTCCLPGSWGA